jgi:hypothetical protein
MEQEIESVSGRIGLFMSIGQGSTMLIVPPKQSAKEAWVIPPQFGQYYKEQDFAKSTVFLQAMAKALPMVNPLSGANCTKASGLNSL